MTNPSAIHLLNHSILDMYRGFRIVNSYLCGKHLYQLECLCEVLFAFNLIDSTHFQSYLDQHLFLPLQEICFTYLPCSYIYSSQFVFHPESPWSLKYFIFSLHKLVLTLSTIKFQGFLRSTWYNVFSSIASYRIVSPPYKKKIICASPILSFLLWLPKLLLCLSFTDLFTNLFCLLQNIT